MENENDDDWDKCPVMKEVYSATSQGPRAPLVGLCGHGLCREALQSMHLAALEDSKRARLKKLACPVCMTPGAFHVEKTTTNWGIIGALKETSRRSNNNIVTPPETATASVAPASLAAPARNPAPPPEVPNAVHQSRQELPASRKRQRPLLDNNDASLVLRTNEDTRVQRQLRAASESTTRTDIHHHGHEWQKQQWQLICKKQGIRFFRIRVFVGSSKTLQDPRGRLCSEWCIQNGYIASSSRAIPDRMLHDADAGEAKRFLEQPIDYVKHVCQSLQHDYFARDVDNKSAMTRYCNAYRMFAGMKQGDVVSMIVPGAPGPSNRESYFGVITSEDLILRTKQEAMDEGFPHDHLFDMDVFNGLMLRKVKWIRKCKVRNLLSQEDISNKVRQVKCLIEAAPFWLMDNTKYKESFQTEVFLGKTEPCSWRIIIDRIMQKVIQ
eukprot:scaffold62468_cov45-Attheya_sp.AAC.1